MNFSLFQNSFIRSSDNLLGMDTPPAKPVVSRRALAEQTQNTETVESTPVSTVAPVDLFDLPQDVSALHLPYHKLENFEVVHFRKVNIESLYRICVLY